MAKTGATKRAGRAAREREQAEAQKLRLLHDRWAQAHPQLARQERALRKQNAAAQRDFAHKRNGTAETHAKARMVAQGAIARLHVSGAITVEQLGAAVEIAAVLERIAADVTVRTVSLETRIDRSARHDDRLFERLGQVRAEVAYSWWRRELTGPAAPILDMVGGDLGVNEIARRYRMDKRRALRILTDALDLWPQAQRLARDSVDETDLAIMAARLR